jgi:Fur family transcriptional regulator, ferric uptake regulator
MTCSEPYAQKLQARGFRMTSQRHAILHILKASGGHLSPSQIYNLAHASISGLTETTVYRTLEFLVDNDIVHPAHNDGGHLTYELAGHDHHHLVCRVCSAQVDLEPAALQDEISQLELQTGYQIDAGHLTFFGLCPDCQARRQ